MTKIRDSRAARFVILAHERGYRITDDGILISGNGNKLVSGIDKRGYLRFSIKGEKATVAVFVHQLAAYQIFGERALYEGIQVRHLDGNSQNNARTNLDIGTASQNQMDKDLAVRKRAAKTAASFQKKLTAEEHNSLMLDRSNGMSYKLIMAKYKIAKSTVSYIVNGKTYQD